MPAYKPASGHVEDDPQPAGGFRCRVSTGCRNPDMPHGFCDTVPEAVRQPKITAPEDSAKNWPELHQDALYGLAGEVVRESAPYTEADPAGVLLSLLSAFGSWVGDGPHMRAGNRPQPARLWSLLVGETGKGKKGTATEVAMQFINAADDGDLPQRASGLVSGAGLIDRVRDANGDDPEAKGFLAGTDDKRLLVVESEFGGALRRGSKPSNDLLQIMRVCWDGGVLESMTKTEKRKATNPHICIIGHITPAELHAEMSAVERAGGTANRLLFGLVRQSKKLPRGSDVPEAVLTTLGAKLTAAKVACKEVGQVERDTESDEWWCSDLYDELTPDEPESEIMAQVTTRAPVQVLRLALVYCLLDGANQIRREHLAAAMAVWRYLLASCRYVFGAEVKSNPDLDKLSAAVKDSRPEGLTMTQISALFGGHKTKDELAELIDQVSRMPGYELATIPRADGKPGKPSKRLRCGISVVS